MNIRTWTAAPFKRLIPGPSPFLSLFLLGLQRLLWSLVNGLYPYRAIGYCACPHQSINAAQTDIDTYAGSLNISDFFKNLADQLKVKQGCRNL